MTERKIQYTEKVSPLKASDFAAIFDNTSIDSSHLLLIVAEAAKCVAGKSNHYEWETDVEQRIFNIIRAVLSNSSKIVRGY
jgi:hypothetical protein